MARTFRLPRAKAQRSARHATNGFSLVEIIVVVAIMTVLALLAVPAVENILKGSRITIAGTAVVDELGLARQTAISKNSPVEVRFLMLPEDRVGAPQVYRGVQTFKIGSDGVLEPLGKVVIFPQGVEIVSGAVASSLFLSGNGPLANVTPKDPDSGNVREAIGGFGFNYKYLSFQFKGDGGTDLNQVPTFVTLVSKRDPIVDQAANLPANFVTVQIDPVNGRTRVYRP